LSRRHAAALICLVSCRGLLEIPDDPRVDPDSRGEHYHRERHAEEPPAAPDAGSSAARTPAVVPVSATGVAVTPSSDAGAAVPSPPRRVAGGADMDASVDAAPDVADSRSPFIAAGAEGAVFH
jgi:hypothetical protein